MSLALKFKQVGYQLVTLLREPTHRFESSFNYEAYGRPKALGYMPGYEGLGELDGFRSWVHDRQGPFDQVKMLAGCWPENGANASSTLVSSSHLEMDLWRDTMDTKNHRMCTFDQPLFAKPREFSWAYGPTGLPEDVKQDIYFRAHTSLSQFALVGITEQMDTTKLLFETMWPQLPVTLYTGEPKQVNANAHTFNLQDLPLEDHPTLAQKFTYDSSLYNNALSRFNQDLESYGIQPVLQETQSLL